MTDRIEQAIEIGRANAHGQRLLANHCVHARASVNTSHLGQMVGLPIGFAQIACQHAPFFGTSMMDLTTLAVEFYEENCIGCPHRSPSGQLPTIASEAEQRRREALDTEAIARAALQAELDAWKSRSDRREASVLGQGYPARDLARYIGEMDPSPAGDADEQILERAAARVFEIARLSPELFNEVLLENVIALAENFKPAAFCVLQALAENGVFDRSRAVAISARAMERAPIPEAAEILDSFSEEIKEEHVAMACRSAIVLSSAPRVGLPGVNPQAHPGALLAFASTSEQTVLRAVIEALADDDEWTRHAGADAARHLLCDAPNRLQHLIAPLLHSIRGKDEGYAGCPYPAAAAVQVVAGAWLLRPRDTCALVERIVPALNDEARTVVVSLARTVMRPDDHDIDGDVLVSTIEFLTRRLSCDWGSEAAGVASDVLTWVARDFPHAIAPLADSLLGALLKDVQPAARSLLHNPTINPLEAMDTSLQETERRRRLSDICESLGLAARHAPGDVLPRVFAFLDAESGDEKTDLRVRMALTHVLEHACAPETISHILPRLYGLLLSKESALRATAVSLWRAFASETKAIPNELESLAMTLLQDRYIIVHGAMADVIPRLRLSDDVARNTVGPLMGIASAHRNSDSKIVASALSSLLWASETHDPKVRSRINDFVVKFSHVLPPFDREQLLLRAALDGARGTGAWASAALQTIADRQQSGFQVSPRRDRLLEALLLNPGGLVNVPLERFLEIAQARGAESPADAEMIELLQSSGRWEDAYSLGECAAAAIPQTEEYKSRREWLGSIVMACAAECASFECAPDARVAPCFGAFKDGEPLHVTHARARSRARAALMPIPVPDPAAASQQVLDALRTLDETIGGDSRTELFNDVLRAVVGLLNVDAAVRSANGEAVQTGIESVRRNAVVFASKARHLLSEDDPILTFFQSVQKVTVDNVDELVVAARAIPLALPLCDSALPRKRRDKTTHSPAQASSQALQPEPVVCALHMNRKLVLDTQVLPQDVAHDLTADVRMREWPAWADGCRLELLTTLPAGTITLPTFDFARTDAVSTERGVLMSRTGHVTLKAGRNAGAPPLELPLHAYFYSNDGQREVCDIIGYERLLLRPYDPSRDKLTDHAQMDQRLLEMYAELYEDPALDQRDLQSFCRFFTACVQAAQRIMFDAKYLSGRTELSERDFHDDFERLLRDDPDLEGRLSRGERLAGGFHDLLHDNIAAELKVEKRTPRIVENATRYLGQPTQYGAGRGSRLSILVVLDHTKKTAPPAVLENHIGWLYPRQHGLDDPLYPSRVGVLIVNTNWPIPSRWSRRRVQTRASA